MRHRQSQSSPIKTTIQIAIGIGLIVTAFLTGRYLENRKQTNETETLYNTYLYEERLSPKISDILNNETLSLNYMSRQQKGLWLLIKENNTLQTNPFIQYTLKNWDSFNIFVWQGGYHADTTLKRYYEILSRDPQSPYAAKIIANYLRKLAVWNKIPYEGSDTGNDFGSILTGLHYAVQQFGPDNPELIAFKTELLQQLENEKAVILDNNNPFINNPEEALLYIQFVQKTITDLFEK